MRAPDTTRPVFFDPKGRRAKVANAILGCCAAAAMFVAAVISYGVYFDLGSPTFSARSEDKPSRALSVDLLPRAESEIPLSFAQGRAIPPDAAKAIRMAFLSTGSTPSAMLSLKRHAEEIDAVIADWLRLRDTDGEVAMLEGPGRAAVVGWFRANVSRIQIYPEITSSLSAAKTDAFLSDRGMQERLALRISAYAADNDFAGVVLNLREMRDSHVGRLAAFVDAVAMKLRAAGKKTILLVAPNTKPSALQTLAALSDFVIAGAYENDSDQAAGAAAGQGWFEDQLRLLIAAVPRSKLIMSIGSFCRDTDLAGRSETFSVQQCWDQLRRTNAQFSFDGGSLNGAFTYHDGKGLPHQAWLLDAATAFNQTKAALATAPAGIALWRLGLEDPGVWHSFGRGRVPDASALQAISIAVSGYGAYASALWPIRTADSRYGTDEGEEGVLLTAQLGDVGVRSVDYDKDLGLIIGEQMTRLPVQVATTTLAAKDPKSVAITFDDGPDPRYTGRILDVLAEKRVGATFYVIGRNVADAPDLIKREYAEGHDVGNHTFSHADPLLLSPGRLEAELNASARVVKAFTGMQMRLFRPPYAGPGFDYLDAMPDVAVTASRLGYMIGELGSVACDYCFISAEWIAQNAENGVVKHDSHVILLHDGGGNREATIKALPMIIDRLRARGYHFVSTHELAGLTRADVMRSEPMTSAVAETEGAVWRVAVRSFGWAANVLPEVCIVAAIAGTLRMFCIIVLAVFQSRQRRRSPPLAPYAGRIAVLVPAYNEKLTIRKTIASILDSTVSDRLEIIVIDDGSTDGTFDTARAAFGGDGRVKILRKENGGKASALNHGIAFTDIEVMVAIDGDTVLLPDAIERLTSHFGDRSVGAVAGNVEVGNRAGLMTAFQALEYVTSQNLERRAFELFNAICVVPGAIGAWRRKAAVESGGYSRDTLAEDTDLTMAVARRGWRVICEPRAHALTEAPETVRCFMKQRFRWMFGTLQAAFKHSGALLERPRGISLITIPNVYLFQFGFTLLSPVMDAVLAASLLHVAVALACGWPLPHGGDLRLIAAYWIAFQAVDLAAAAAGIVLDGRSGYLRLLPLVVLQRFTYRQLLYVAAITALLAAAKGSAAGWGKLLRTGNVPFAPRSREMSGETSVKLQREPCKEIAT